METKTEDELRERLKDRQSQIDDVRDALVKAAASLSDSSGDMEAMLIRKSSEKVLKMLHLRVAAVNELMWALGYSEDEVREWGDAEDKKMDEALNEAGVTA